MVKYTLSFTVLNAELLYETFYKTYMDLYTKYYNEQEKRLSLFDSHHNLPLFDIYVLLCLICKIA